MILSWDNIASPQELIEVAAIPLWNCAAKYTFFLLWDYYKEVWGQLKRVANIQNRIYAMMNDGECWIWGQFLQTSLWHPVAIMKIYDGSEHPCQPLTTKHNFDHQTRPCLHVFGQIQLLHASIVGDQLCAKLLEWERAGNGSELPMSMGKNPMGLLPWEKPENWSIPSGPKIKSCLPSMGMKRKGMTLVFSVTQVLSRLNLPGLRWRWLGANEEIPCASLCALNIIELWRYCDKTWNLKMLLMWCRWIPQQKPCKFPRFQRSL